MEDFCWSYSWIQKREFIRGVNMIQSQFSQNTKTMGQSRKEVSWCRLLLSFVGGRRYEVLKYSAYSLMTTFLEKRPILYFLIFHFSVPTWFSLESFCGLFMTTFPILSKLFSKANTTEKQFQRKWWLYTTCQSLLRKAPWMSRENFQVLHHNNFEPPHPKKIVFIFGCSTLAVRPWKHWERVRASSPVLTLVTTLDLIWKSKGLLFQTHSLSIDWCGAVHLYILAITTLHWDLQRFAQQWCTKVPGV